MSTSGQFLIMQHLAERETLFVSTYFLRNYRAIHCLALSQYRITSHGNVAEMNVYRAWHCGVEIVICPARHARASMRGASAQMRPEYP